MLDRVEVDILFVGHVCHDRVISKSGEVSHVLGGAASFGSMLAASMGMSPMVHTSYGSDFKFEKYLMDLGIAMTNVPARSTTEFENIYSEEGRHQYLHHRAERLTKVDLPKESHSIPVVHICPIADEVDRGLLHGWGEAFVAVSLQGWLRKWEDDKRIRYQSVPASIFAGVDMLFLSKEDIATEPSFLEKLIAQCDLVVCTDGPNGADIYRKGIYQYFPAYPVQEVDPTGAGDTYATSFLISYYRLQDIAMAAATGHAAASLAVEQVGCHIPNMQDLEARVESYFDLHSHLKYNSIK